MEVKNQNAIAGAGVGAVAGAGAGLLADKLIKMDPKKPVTAFVSNFQANLINKKVAKDVFQKTNYQGNIIEKASSALDNAGQFIAKAADNGKKNFAQRWNLDLQDGKATAQNLIEQLSKKTDEAIELFAKKLKNCRKGNMIAVGVAALATLGALVGSAISKGKKAE